ncbi:unnamed protein product [Urochloa humidicola]
MSRAEAAIRRAGALMALAAASALMLPFLAGAEHHAVLLALHALFLLGCAAVQLSPAHRAVVGLARQAAEAVRGKALGASAAGLRRWAGFAGIVFYALYEIADVQAEAEALGKVKAFLLFPVFLGAVWAVYLSMVTGRGAPAPQPSAAATEDDGDELNDPSCTCPC